MYLTLLHCLLALNYWLKTEIFKKNQNHKNVFFLDEKSSFFLYIIE